MLTDKRVKELRKLAIDIRAEVAKAIAATEAKRGHIGGSFSIANF